METEAAGPGDERNQAGPVLLVDDDPGIRDVVATYLVRAGFTVGVAGSAEEAWLELERVKPRILLLDVLLPGASGLDFLRGLPEPLDMGVILLTRKGELDTRVLGLELGADDFLAKPFHLRELLARVRSLLRRIEGAESEPIRLDFGIWRIDERAQRVLDRVGEEVPLTPSEFDLLLALAKRAPRTVSRDELSVLTRRRSLAVDDRSIDVQISRIRRKMRDALGEAPTIRSVRGTGYVLSTQPAD